MAISKQNKEFIQNLINYYINEATSYKQIAENYTPDIDSVPDTTFGIIVGSVYSEFMRVYQKQSPSLEDIQEFNKIIKDNAHLIKESITKKPEKPSVKTS